MLSASFTDATRSQRQSRIILASSDRGDDAVQPQSPTDHLSSESALSVEGLDQHKISTSQPPTSALGGNIVSAALCRSQDVGSMYQNDNNNSSNVNDDSDSEELVTYMDQSVLKFFEGRDDDVNEGISAEEENVFL